MSLYESSILQFKITLGQIDKWLDAGLALADTKKFDVSVLMNSRLAPDQFPLLAQIQSACDAAKSTAARLTGQEPPTHPDTETTLGEIRARIAKVLNYLDTFQAADFVGAEERKIVQCRARCVASLRTQVAFISEPFVPVWSSLSGSTPS